MSKGHLTGMDVAHVRDLARRMQTEADQIDQLVKRVSNQLEQLDWVGRDREQFLEEWHSGHAGHLLKVVQGLQHASREATEYANRQEWASRA